VHGGTPLHNAVLSGDEEIIKYLVFHGAFINAVDNQRRTSLDVAVRLRGVASLRNDNVISFLINNGAV
jgi:ankyrin repeat protein